jgi:hypothetical protein
LSNTRHTGNGAKLPGTREIRQAVAASAEVQEHTLAHVIGETVALHLARLLGELLPQVQGRGECFFCVLAAKQLVQAHQVAVVNAQAAGEEPPAMPEPPGVARGITLVMVSQVVQAPGGPVPQSGSVWACWDHVQLPSAPPRQVGLVGPDGSPIIARG